MQGVIWNELHTKTYLIFIVNPWGKFYDYSHFKVIEGMLFAYRVLAFKCSDGLFKLCIKQKMTNF